MRQITLTKSVVVGPEGKILVLQRSLTDENRPGGADLPGGNPEPGEDLYAAAAREINEEAGLAVTAKDLQLVHARTTVHEDKDAAITRLVYAANVPDASVTISFEHETFWWLSPEDALAKLDGTMWHEGLAFALEHKLLGL
jgi:8-oxo-dGTP diphosphatase